MLINLTHPYADRALDFYRTPPEATRALMRIETLPESIVDPCVGDGAVVDILRDEGGHLVYGCDIVDRGWPRTIVGDYLAEPMIMNDLGIVTNPPYRAAQAFIEKAIHDGALYHAWLLRTNFLESVGRKPFFERYPPSRIWVSSRRLPMMHRDGWGGPKAKSNQAFAWFVWDSRTPERVPGTWVGWFDWRDAEPRKVHV